MAELNGKVAVVTGAAQGIGLAIARALAERGARVALVDINSEKARTAAAQLAQSGHDTFSAGVDVADRDSLAQMFQQVAAHFGQIDVLVNNAGVLTSTSIADLEPNEWERVMRINLGGTFFASQQVIPYLKTRPQPRIINISSLAGRMGGFETGMAYTASKGGVISLTYGMARQLAPLNITVNCVCPGTTATEMINQWSDEQKAGLIARIPLGRLGQPENIGSAVCYLASDEASFITGLLLDVNGGMYFG